MQDVMKLAINGGPPVRSAPWLNNFTTGDEERRAAVDVIEGGYLSLFEGSYTPDEPFSFWGGPRVQEMERSWCEYYGAPYAVSMNSATSGLYAAIGALEVGYGDEVIVSPYTMTACATACLVYGAIPIFADVQTETGCLDPASVEAHITKRTRAILVIHQFGIPADMDPIMELARKYDLRVIEDCAQSHGTLYKGRSVGTIGDIGVFSLNVNKTIQTGEGGICLTKGEDLRYRLALIRNHGEAVVGPARYDNIVNTIGFNYRLSEVSAAMASEQIKKLDDLNAARIGLVNQLNDGLSGHDFLVTPPVCSHRPACSSCKATYYIYTLRYLPEVMGIKRDRLVKAINAEGIAFNQGYTSPLYLQPVYQRKLAFKRGYPFSALENRDSVTNYHSGACPNSETLYYKQMITNEHIRPPHTPGDIDDIVEAVEKVASLIKA